MSARPLAVYCNWSAYDELSDPDHPVPLTEDLAMAQLAELVRLRRQGVRFDVYLMDCFWYAPDGGYRTWRTPHFPAGGDRWLAACREAGVLPGLWIGLNSLSTSKVAHPDWAASLSADGRRASLSAGPFLAHLVAGLEHWYDRGVRLFKFDFADLGAGTPDQVATLLPSDLRAANAAALRGALAAFRRTRPDCRLIAYNGLEETYLQGGTADWGRRSLDTRWMECFDTVYTGDPRPADVPAADFWRSKDVYSDHLVRSYHAQGWPLERLDNAGFMIGTTATCYHRGVAGWKGMLLLSLARGGGITTFYGNLDLIDDTDARWWAEAQTRHDRLQAAGTVTAFGGIPGCAAAYGWASEAGMDGLWTAVNPAQARTTLRIPGAAGATVVFHDGTAVPDLRTDGDDLLADLAPEQLLVVGRGCGAGTLGTEPTGPRAADLVPVAAVVRQDPTAPFRIPNRTEAVVAEPPAGVLRIVVRQVRGGRPHRSCGLHHGWGLLPHDRMLTITAEQGGAPLAVARSDDKAVWAGLSWAVGRIEPAPGRGPVLIRVAAAEPLPVDLGISVFAERP